MRARRSLKEQKMDRAIHHEELVEVCDNKKAKERFRRPAYGAISGSSEKDNTKEIAAKKKKQLDLWKKCYAKRTAAV